MFKIKPNNIVNVSNNNVSNIKYRVRNALNYTYKPTVFLDETTRVDSSSYSRYEDLIAFMIAKGELDRDFLQGRANFISDAKNCPVEPLSITNVKGVDGFDCDTHFSRIRNKILSDAKALLDASLNTSSNIDNNVSDATNSDTNKN